MFKSGQYQAPTHQYMMHTSLGIPSRDLDFNQRMQLGGIGDISSIKEGSKVTPGNVKSHIEFDLLKDLDLDPQDLNDIKFYKKKLVIDDYFKKERNPEKRREMFQSLLRQFHPDKNVDNNIDTELKR